MNVGLFGLVGNKKNVNLTLKIFIPILPSITVKTCKIFVPPKA